MAKAQDSQYESGWREVLRIVGILSATGVVFIAAIATIVAFRPNQYGKFNEKAVTATISATSGKCSPEFPLEIRLTNISQKDTLNVGFMIEVSDAGHSTGYWAKIMSTDQIIPPASVYHDCYRMPAFQVGNTYPEPAVGVPYNLATPQYAITVSGVRLRDES